MTTFYTRTPGEGEVSLREGKTAVVLSDEHDRTCARIHSVGNDGAVSERIDWWDWARDYNGLLKYVSYKSWTREGRRLHSRRATGRRVGRVLLWTGEAYDRGKRGHRIPFPSLCWLISGAREAYARWGYGAV